MDSATRKAKLEELKANQFNQAMTGIPLRYKGSTRTEIVWRIPLDYLIYNILSQDTVDETIDTRLSEKERRMTEIMESMPIPLFNNISEDLGDEDIKALIRDYVRRTKKS